MTQPTQLHSRPGKRSSAVLALCLALVVGGCVSETINAPFGGARSDAQALRDYIQLATGYIEQGDMPNARRHLNNAAGIDSNNSEVFALWGLVYSREGEPALADDSFLRALRVDPGNSQARNNYAAFLFAESRFDDAYEQLEVVVEDTTYTNRAQAFENLGLAALRVGRNADAEYAFSRALQLNSNQLRSGLELTSLYILKPDLVQAQRYYAAYLTLIQFYNIAQTPRGLWVGIQLENALGNEANVRQYGSVLQTSFPTSPEYQLYRQFLGTREDD